MSIAKMQKFSLLTFYEQKDAVLQQLQDFQGVELLSSEMYYESEETTGVLTPVRDEQKQTEEVENQFDQVNWGLQLLEEYVPKKGMLEKLRQPIKRYTLHELAQAAHTYPWQEVCQTLRKQDKRLRLIEQEKRELLAQEAELNRWKYFEDRPQILNELKKSGGLLGSLPNSEFAAFTKGCEKLPLVYFETVYQSQTTTYLFVLFHKDVKDKVSSLLKKTAFEQYTYPYSGLPKDDLQHVKEKSHALIEEEKSIKHSLRAMSEEQGQLRLVAEYLDGAIKRAQSNEKLLRSAHAVAISGWIPVEQAAELEKRIQQASKDTFYLEYQQVKEQEIEDVPILLNNSRWIQPFEGLVRMYSLPQYDELDPTPFMAPFYMVAFGMMVADFGYGLLLFLATFLGKKFFHLSKGLEQNLTLFQLCSIPTIIWGLIYGNFFGFELSFQLLSAQEDVNQILVLSIIFGYIQIMFGLALKFYVLWKRKDQKLQAVFQAGSWMVFLISVVLLAAGMLLLPDSPLQTIGLIMIIASLVAVVFGGSLEGKTLAGKIGSGLYGLMDVTNYVGDMISFTRLMALGVAGGSIASAFNLIISYLPIAARFTVGILLFVALHALNIFLSYLSAYVHGIRLQYLEYFGKFFTGGGRAFVPFKTDEKYVEVISEEKMQEEKNGKLD